MVQLRGRFDEEGAHSVQFHGSYLQVRNVDVHELMFACEHYQVVAHFVGALRPEMVELIAHRCGLCDVLFGTSEKKNVRSRKKKSESKGG